MKRASIGEVQHNLAPLLRDVAHGEEVLITRRGTVVARLSAAREDVAAEYPDFAQRAREVFGEVGGPSLSATVMDDRAERL